MTQKLFKQVYVTPRLKIIATKMMRVSYKSKARLTLRQHLVPPKFLVGFILMICLVFCIVLCLLFVFIMCLVRLMLPVTPDCSFLNEPSVFSDVYYEYSLFII